MLSAPRASRIESIDALRGVAVLGILMMNMQAFAMVSQAYMNPTIQLDFTGANQSVWFFAHVFFEMKFITIFSALFGAGIVLMVGEDKDPQAVRVHYRRMLWLLLFGMLHAYIIWFGDILAPYAIWGMIAVMMRGLSARRLFVIGAGLFALGALLWWGFLFSLGYMPEDALQSSYAPTPEMVADMVAAHQAGGLERLGENALVALQAQIGSILFLGPRLLGVMVWGMALYKWGFFSNRWSAPAYMAGALVTLPVGIGADWWGGMHHIESGFAAAEYAPGALVNFLVSPLTSFGYACLVMLACRPAFLKWVRAPFAAVGKMALTNYLTHSLVGFFVFAGPPGLGFFGEWERVQQFQLVLAIWIFQLAFSVLWLSAFRFGPFEWLWRTLTYGKLQPMRKAPEPAAA
ncbi:MAG: DUF418 domain-containing protein [Euryhalocaulis sp.]|uniref:DUF418 domain-containing protein n=1 Tax=Euryhalocaulis sp. TaxID=2744307 RepID=UPI0017DBF0C2|nr:DUF418 domain-containing protein [Euryhalocaulis sp.]MBA4801663.1 DUF418 domain-containing protein [Euryhalocaulis sp.]